MNNFPNVPFVEKPAWKTGGFIWIVLQTRL